MWVAAAWLVCLNLGQSPPDHKAVVGAIRWDGWTGDGNPVGQVVNETLGPARFHIRLPFFAKVTGANSVDVNESTQDQMDRQIQAAAKAELSYWAFCSYPKETGLDRALNLYRNSKYRKLLSYCLILNVNPNPDWKTLAQTHFKDSSYQRVLGDRPLLYLFSKGNMTAKDVVQMRETARESGLPNPYVVVLSTYEEAKELGADALSRYASSGVNREPFRDLAARENFEWESLASRGLPLIPFVSAGWDPRPRVVTKTPWSSYGADQWAETPTPTEISSHLSNAIRWNARRKSLNPTGNILMYAWNEFDEGGWLCPTLAEGTARLDTIQSVLKPSKPPETAKCSASSTLDPIQNAEMAFDGLVSTNWQAALGSSFSDQWLKIEFGSPRRVNRVILSEFGNRTQSFAVDAKVSGNWREVYRGGSIGDSIHPSLFEFETTVSKQFRLRFLKGTFTPIVYECSFEFTNKAAK